ncbi:MAG: lasso peptide biosynthesis B2 protein [Pseudomonadota bacterium]|nr:lasso peptide biosynthesis B2 protein [Pseudomonadota bacterium]
MSLASDWRRLKAMSWRDCFFLAEASFVLAVASLAIHLMPFRRVVSAVSRDGGAKTDRAGSFDEIARARWAVEACARRLPWKIVCFQKGLAMQVLLRRRGIATALHYGVAQDQERGLSAHVWVTYAGEAIIGGDRAGEYTCLATFPSRSS